MGIGLRVLELAALPARFEAPAEDEAPAEETGTFPPVGLLAALVPMPAGAGAVGGRFEPLGGGKVLVPMVLPVGFGATAEGLGEVMPVTLTAGGGPLVSWVEVLAMAARPESW